MIGQGAQAGFSSTQFNPAAAFRVEKLSRKPSWTRWPPPPSFATESSGQSVEANRCVYMLFIDCTAALLRQIQKSVGLQYPLSASFTPSSSSSSPLSLPSIYIFRIFHHEAAFLAPSRAHERTSRRHLFRNSYSQTKTDDRLPDSHSSLKNRDTYSSTHIHARSST